MNDATRDSTFWDALDPDTLHDMASRREALAGAARLGGRLALASVPVALAATARDAFAQSLPGEVVEVLNFALTLEHLENQFYLGGLGASGLIPAVDRSIFETIQAHEEAHVDFLVGALGSQAVDPPSFDFTAGGAFAPFQDYGQFRLLAQAFEDTGVRAYKGQAPALAGSDMVLEAALTIHSVEARHAARVRRLNGGQGWIPQDQPDAAAAVAAVYAGEDRRTQLGVDVLSVTSVGSDGVTESFDEPLTMEEVLAIAGPFIES